MEPGITRFVAILPLALALSLLAGLAQAQSDSGQIVVTPLDPIDPLDPTDPPDPPDPPDQSTLPDLGLTIAPDIGLDVGSDSGIVDSGTGLDGPALQVTDGDDDVSLITTRDTRASTNVNTVAAAEADGATLRALDKTLGQTTDISLMIGETVAFGRIAVRLMECRYPVDNPASDAFAHLTIAALDGRTLFDGWMVASSPALMALEHPRYDVWVLSCNTS